eukprot:TRINITY_DN14857_c0_g4_i1.p1 TRINITY_DN14857_c0_g4~~TRINITY_DN14857_c0_g4_i1.p1  ORF type:complete len:799 (-),score=145.10 TRINITY_DN14857_c0_g4_i1:286-2571(-)
MGPDPCEIFLGGLPKDPELLPVVESSLAAALAAFAATFPDAAVARDADDAAGDSSAAVGDAAPDGACVGLTGDGDGALNGGAESGGALGGAGGGTGKAAVRLRLHTSLQSERRGLGYGFAWLPSAEAAASLAAAGHFTYELRGVEATAYVRAARGHRRGRAPPPAEPMAACLEVVAFTDLNRAAVTAVVDTWQKYLRTWSVALQLRHVDISEGNVSSTAGNCAGEGIAVVCPRPGSERRSDDGTEQLAKQLTQGGRPVLLFSGAIPESADPSESRGLDASASECPGIDVVDWQNLASLYPSCASGAESELAAVFVTLVVRRAVAWHLRDKLKVFVCDCDQTLWGGVVAEDGVAELDMGGPHGMLQERMSKLQQSGRLICLSSRNDEDDVLKVFDERKNCMNLDRSQLAAWQVNWGPKSLSIRWLASELRLGLDAFAFLDDNPGETEAVKVSLPEVLTMTVPSGNHEAFRRFLHHHWALDVWRGFAATAEDLQRTQMYRENAQRKVARRQAPNYDAFLQSLDLCIELRSPVGPEMARASQLSLRTNQMNSTQLRFATEGTLRDWLSTEGRWLVAAWVSDRFGDYGLVACACCARGVDAVVVECLNMSCRVLHRGVEEAVLRRVAEDACEAGFDKVVIPVVETPRNGLMRGFLDRVAAWADVCSAAVGEPVSFGRYGDRKGSVAPAMEVPSDKLKQLRGSLSDAADSDDGAVDASPEPSAGNAKATGDADEISIVNQPLTVNWSGLLSELAVRAETCPGNGVA